MAIKFLSILIFSFALGLVALGTVTWWVEKGRRRNLGLAMVLTGLVIAGGYAFLGSRYAITLWGRLIITVDLPRLMATALLYTLGVLAGLGLSGGLFLWLSGRLVQPTRLERKMGTFLCAVLLIALLISLLAMQISR